MRRFYIPAARLALLALLAFAAMGADVAPDDDGCGGCAVRERRAEVSPQQLSAAVWWIASV